MYYALSRGKVLNERVLDVRFPSPLAYHRNFLTLSHNVDPLVKWSAAFSLSYPDCYTPLLP